MRFAVGWRVIGARAPRKGPRVQGSTEGSRLAFHCQ